MAEKQYKPTQRKLREARKQGEVVRGRELTSLAAFVALWIFLGLGGGYWWRHLTRIADHAIRAADPTSEAAQTGWVGEVQSLGLEMVWILGPLLCVGAAAAVLVGGLQTRGLISFAPLIPKFERINPGQGLRNLFSTRHLFDLGKMLVKTLLLIGMLFYCIGGSLDSLVRTTYASVGDVLPIGAALVWRLMGGVAVIFALGAALDYAHQFYEFMKKQKMSVEELRREFRETDGDPHMKRRRRALAREMIFNPATGSGPTPSVVVVNPTHVSVALYYESGKTPLPRVVAKGLDAAALEIRAKAERDGVPVLEDQPLARKLYREVELGQYINEESIDAVAAVFRWVRLTEEQRRNLIRLALSETESDTTHRVNEPGEVRSVDLAPQSGDVHVDDVVDRGGSAHVFPNLLR
jgi:type III secretion protein U